MWEEPKEAAKEKLRAQGKENSGGVLEIHRLKAKITLSNGEIKIIQAVREVFEILDSPRSHDSTAISASGGKIVLIGRYLVDLPFEQSLINTLNG